jgi:hypothetical protein
VAARLQRELGAEVEMVRGRYGEFKVLVDGEEVASGGLLAAVGVLPSIRGIIAAVRAHLSEPPKGDGGKK